MQKHRRRHKRNCRSPPGPQVMLRGSDHLSHEYMVAALVGCKRVGSLSQFCSATMADVSGASVNPTFLTLVFVVMYFWSLLSLSLPSLLQLTLRLVFVTDCSG